MSFSSYNKNRLNKGFSLTELMVSIGIMLVITSVVVLNQDTYTSSVTLSNLANDISLSARQAQIYGISVKGTAQGVFSNAYGVSFQKNVVVGDENKSYIFFADAGGPLDVYDGTWACNANDQTSFGCIQKTIISNGNKIEDICIILPSRVQCGSVGRVDITFLRPDTKANIVFWDTNLSIFSGQPNLLWYGARIKVVSPNLLRHYVDVYTTGQISVN